MHDVAARYGIKVKRNMCSCPFHGADKHPSMKIYKDGFKCFTCNKAGDVFTFVQEIENCDFKQAFYILGGSYEHSTKASQIALYHAQKAKEQREINKVKQEQKKQCINQQIHSAREQIEQHEAGSDAWWNGQADMYNGITKDLNLEGGE